MVEDTARRLTEHLLDTVDEGLRTVVVVQADGYELIYLREDLSETYTESAFAEVVDTFRLEQPFMSPAIEHRPVGERRAIVHYHENAFVLQFPYSEAESILISLSRDAGRNLFRFIETCREIVHDSP